MDKTDTFQKTVLKHRFLVRKIALKIYQGINPSYIDLEDLISEGYIGLIEAAKKYRSGNQSFRSFAAKRIRHRIIDWLRKFKLSRGEIKKLKENQNYEPRNTQYRVSCIQDQEHKQWSESPENVYERYELFKKIVLVLDPIEIIIIILFFFKEMRQDEISSLLKISPSQCSQLKTKALLKLKKEYFPIRSSQL